MRHAVSSGVSTITGQTGVVSTIARGRWIVPRIPDVDPPGSRGPVVAGRPGCDRWRDRCTASVGVREVGWCRRGWWSRRWRNRCSLPRSGSIPAIIGVAASCQPPAASQGEDQDESGCGPSHVQPSPAYEMPHLSSRNAQEPHTPVEAPPSRSECSSSSIHSFRSNTVVAVMPSTSPPTPAVAHLSELDEVERAHASFHVLVVGEEGSEGFAVAVVEGLEASLFEVLEDGLDLGETVNGCRRRLRCCGAGRRRNRGRRWSSSCPAVGVVAGVPPELHAATTTVSTATLFSFPLMPDTIRKPARPS